MELEITLQFDSPDALWAFRIERNVTLIEMDNAEKMLTCRCSKDSLQIAISKYHASLILQKPGSE